MASPEQSTEVPSALPAVLPTGGLGHTQAIVNALEKSIGDLKTDVREVRSTEHTHFIWLITALAGGFLLVCGVLVAGYFRLDDKIDKLTQSSIRVETKLEDLLQRIPPAVIPVPKRQ